MTYPTEDAYAAAVDPKMNQRTCSVAVTEAYNNPAVADGTFAERVRRDPFGTPITEFQWPVAVNCLASYQSGVASGGDGADNVTDGEILAAVQAHWPPEPAP